MDDIAKAAERWNRDADLRQAFWLGALEAKAAGRADYIACGHEAARAERNIDLSDQWRHYRIEVEDRREPYSEEPSAPDSVEQWCALERFRAQLGDLDREIAARFQAGETQQEIATSLCMSQPAISYRLKVQCTRLERLRNFEMLAREFEQYGPLLKERELRACRAVIAAGSVQDAIKQLAQSQPAIAAALRRAAMRLPKEVGDRLRLLAKSGTWTLRHSKEKVHRRLK